MKKPPKARRSAKLKITRTTAGALVKLDFRLPRNYAEVEKIFGKFEWHDLENTRGADITIDPSWTRKNVARVEVPEILPRPVYIHTRLAASFKSCIIEAARRYPSYKILSCASFVPRHKRHDPKADLSLHSWSIAFDLNPRTNPYGAYVPLANKPPDEKPRAINIYYDMPPEWISVFEEAGWFWGGRFKGRKDAMHFQAAIGV